jgi:hypothetical protein
MDGMNGISPLFDGLGIWIIKKPELIIKNL